VSGLEVGGVRLRLLPQRAAWLVDHGVLLVADAHIGKAVSFRRLGMPVPGGTTSETLQRLSDAVAASGARHVVFLGDLLHSARSRAAATWAAVAQWRSQHATLALTLVRGNHDSHAGDPPPEWGVTCLNGPLRLPGLESLALAHHPDPVPGAYVLAGHIHPAAVLGGRARDSLRLPCFHFGPDVGVLPAFGAFTGTHVLPRGPEDRVYVVAGDSVRELPVPLRFNTLGR
jgi:DNA ligase-associated metallophosphoesterase